MLLRQTVTPAEIAGNSTNNIAITAPYTSIDAGFLFAQPDLTTVGSVINPAAITPGDVWIYQTDEGYRGKLVINSVATTSIPGDTINFNIEVWDSGGALINSASGVNIVACTSGNCHFDFHQSPPVVTGSPSSDLWWSSTGGILALIPDSTGFLRKYP